MNASILDNPNVQKTIWGLSAVTAAVTCPLAFGTGLIYSVTYNVLDQYVKVKTQKDIGTHGLNLLMKAIKVVKLDKLAYGANVAFGILVLSTVGVAPRGKNVKSFDVVLPAVYGMAAAVFRSGAFGLLAGLKIGSLAFHEINQIVHIERRFV